ncbi:MAG: hypothetical protein QXJ62_07135 [Nitrososphaeria archaeon]
MYTLEQHPRDYSRVQKKIGLAYSKLADIENNSDNYNLALGSLKKAADAYKIRKSMREYLVVTDFRIKVAREFIHNGGDKSVCESIMNDLKRDLEDLIIVEENGQDINQLKQYIKDIKEICGIS